MELCKWRRHVSGHEHPARPHELHGILHRLHQVVVPDNKEPQLLADKVPKLVQAKVEGLRHGQCGHCHLQPRPLRHIGASIRQLQDILDRLASLQQIRRITCGLWQHPGVGPLLC